MSISIIVPIYNGVEEYFRICMDSILNQTYRDIEVIIVDDGSTAEIAAVVDEYGALDERVKVLHQPNRGVSTARNRGIELSSGDWIMFADADDYLEKDACEKLIRVIDRCNPDILYFNIYMDKDGEIIKERYDLPETCNGDFSDMKSLLYERFLYVSNHEIANYRNEIMGLCANRIIRSSLLKSNNLFYKQNIPLGEDTLHNLHTCKMAKKICFSKEYCYHYRINEQSVNHKFRNNSFSERIIFFDELNDFFSSCGISLHGNLANALYARILNDSQRALMQYSFHKDFTGGVISRIRSARDFLNNKHTSNALKKLDPDYIKPKQKIKLFIVKHKLLFTDYVLSRMLFNS